MDPNLPSLANNISVGQYLNSTTTAMSSAMQKTHSQAIKSILAQQTMSMETNHEVIIRIREVENGRIITVNNRDYIVTPDQSLIDVIRVALVNLKLE